MYCHSSCYHCSPKTVGSLWWPWEDPEGGFLNRVLPISRFSRVLNGRCDSFALRLPEK